MQKKFCEVTQNLITSTDPTPDQLLDATIDVALTPKAIARVWNLVQKKEQPEQYGLRFYISGGGCSGFQYGFKLDQAQADKDLEVLNQHEHMQVKLYIDKKSLAYLQGSVIDFVESLQGSHFKVENPNAKGTCGCGSSFNI
ncbi:MAG: iron-sulfur cluster insertion protein ErpA [Gammaproteobacteria bacterium]